MTVTEYRTGVTLPGKRVVALGFFDGVHAGHRALLARAKAEAEARGAEFAVFTFYAEDPALKGGKNRLYATADKQRLLEECGVGQVIYARLCEVGGMSGEAFVNRVLIEAFGCSLAVCGYNFRFGAGAACGAKTLAELTRLAGCDCIVVDEYRQGGAEISSTGIKELLSAGDVARANRALGKPYFLRGKVSRGRGLGHTFGYPTLNLPFAAGTFVPRHGVYVSAVTVGGETYPALTDVGTCPTFGAREAHSETYLLAGGADWYGEVATVSLLAFLRDEESFPTAEELMAQIGRDVAAARAIFEKTKGIFR